MIPLSPPICPVQQGHMNLDTFVTQITLSSTKIPTAAPALQMKLKPHLYETVLDHSGPNQLPVLST